MLETPHSVSVRTGNRIPTKVSLWILEQVRKHNFMSEATVIWVSSLLWDGSKSEIIFLRYFL